MGDCKVPKVCCPPPVKPCCPAPQETIRICCEVPKPSPPRCDLKPPLPKCEESGSWGSTLLKLAGVALVGALLFAAVNYAAGVYTDQGDEVSLKPSIAKMEVMVMHQGLNEWLKSPAVMQDDPARHLHRSTTTIHAVTFFFFSSLAWERKRRRIAAAAEDEAEAAAASLMSEFTFLRGGRGCDLWPPRRGDYCAHARERARAAVSERGKTTGRHRDDRHSGHHHHHFFFFFSFCSLYIYLETYQLHRPAAARPP
ncbi:unnamed protein product [Notodromas monacha]|uniref:Uncharacterized protein n=1 Tax=Notodromas monacha TaxID=399045 RepID=A0A7R9GEJ1_9CRUS|nr:unnamed protein product [Notodromas monacha]CAG0918111.1 unnamed protein product [Notodromas monacha]